MKKMLAAIFILICLNSFCNEKRIICYNLFEGTTDTLDISKFDTTITSENTSFFIGNADNNIANLSNEIPEENVYSGTNYTKKKQASLVYDINDFPIRTSVRTFKWENDSLTRNCSGSIISRRHILTAAHCAVDFNDFLLCDSFYVAPAFDNGEFNSTFNGSWVKKVYFFENWSFNEDFSIMELEEPIGENTGWISIGFNTDNTSLLDGIFYKFSYPGITIPGIDPNTYNGDTLYFGYGVADSTRENSIFIKETTGIPGESGSSLIKVSNNISYISYGALSFSNHLNHCRLTAWEYFAFKDIIKDDLSIYAPDYRNNNTISFYPNPASDIIHISMPEDSGGISIFNSQGKEVKYMQYYGCETTIDISDLPAGIYLLKSDSDNSSSISKLIKM